MLHTGLRGRKLLVAITLTAGLGWVLYGLENGALGGVISGRPFQARFDLSPTMQGTVTGVFMLGCFIGAMAMCLYGEILSRRHNLLFFTCFIIAGGAIQVSSFGKAQLIVGRIVAGVGMGGISSTLPIWQSETSPSNIRGTVVCVSLSFLIVGQLIAYWCDYGVAKYDNDFSWRFPFSLQMIAAVLMCICTLFMPESPRYLVAHNDSAQARIILSALADLPVDHSQITEQLIEIEHAIELERASAKGWGDLFRRTQDGNGEKRRMATAVVVQVCQAFSGSTVISYYVTPIFENSVGFEHGLASLMSGYLQVFFLVASIGTWWLIENVGRRRLFMISATAMAIVMFIMAGMIKLDTHVSGIVAAVMLFAYQAFFTWGWMAGVWIYCTEINPLSWRSKGVGLAVALQWLFDFVLLQVTPPGIDNIGWGMYIIFAIFNLAFVPFIYFFCPETAGIPLESIDLLYLPGMNPVKESKRLRKRLQEGSEGPKIGLVAGHKADAVHEMEVEEK